MPFVSQDQRKWMHASEPELAARWEKCTPKGKKLPERVDGKGEKKKDEKGKEAMATAGILKAAVSDLLKLDAKGISPGALQQIYAHDLPGVMRYPGIVALVARRRERLRRIQEELQNPMSHLKPAKPSPAEAAVEEQGIGNTPMAPGSPTPPSNMLGMFDPNSMPGMGAPAGGLPKFGGYPAELVKLADEDHESPAEEAVESPDPEGCAEKLEEKEARVGAYKYGFFRKVAELGLTPGEFAKCAADGEGSLPAWLGEKALGAGKAMMTAPMIAAPILGALAGGTYRLATAPSYESPEQLRELELLALYRKLIRQALKRARKMQETRLGEAGGGEAPIEIPAIT